MKLNAELEVCIEDTEYELVLKSDVYSMSYGRDFNCKINNDKLKEIIIRRLIDCYEAIKNELKDANNETVTTVITEIKNN